MSNSQKNQYKDTNFKQTVEFYVWFENSNSEFIAIEKKAATAAVVSNLTYEGVRIHTVKAFNRSHAINQALANKIAHELPTI